MRINRISNRTAKVLVGIALVVLFAGQWVLVSGPLSDLNQQGLAAAAHSDGAGVLMYGGLNFLLSAALPVITGGIALCVLAVFSAYSQTFGADNVIDAEVVRLPRQRG